MIQNEVVPDSEKDEKIKEYLTLIRETGADILGNDAQTQEILKRRNAVTGNDALEIVRSDVLAVAGELAEASEGALPRLMDRDAELATSVVADPEEKHVASYRLSGRILRFGLLATGGVAAVGGTISGAKEIVWVGKKIVASPQFQTVMEAVLRWLGF